jgi:DNA-binding response OmpR family regulator
LDELRELASDWGVAAVLVKPFSPSQLVAAVRAAVARLPDAEPGDT